MLKSRYSNVTALGRPADSEVGRGARSCTVTRDHASLACAATLGRSSMSLEMSKRAPDAEQTSRPRFLLGLCGAQLPEINLNFGLRREAVVQQKVQNEGYILTCTMMLHTHKLHAPSDHRSLHPPHDPSLVRSRSSPPKEDTLPSGIAESGGRSNLARLDDPAEGEGGACGASISGSCAVSLSESVP